MDKLRRSWRLMVASLNLLRRNRGLLLLPLVSGASILVLLGLVLGGGVLVLLPHLRGGDHVELVLQGWQAWAAFGILAVTYLLCSFIAIFFNSALVGCTLRQLEGKPCSVRDGLRMAWERRGAIFGWALLYSAVGVLLSWLEERLSALPFVGALISKIILRLVGATWTLVTFLIVPVIVFEEQPSVWARVRRSVGLFKRTWGEQILGRVGIGTVLGLLFLVAALLLWVPAIVVALMSHGGAGPVIAVLAAGALTVVLAVGLMLVGNALGGIYTSVLYSYAVTGMLPQEFSPDLLPQPKKA
jgi:hypothetical protein